MAKGTVSGGSSKATRASTGAKAHKVKKRLIAIGLLLTLATTLVVTNVKAAREAVWKSLQTAGVAIGYTFNPNKDWSDVAKAVDDIWKTDAEIAAEVNEEKMQGLADLGAPQVDESTINFYNSNSSKGTNPIQDNAAYSFVEFQGDSDLEYQIELTTTNGKTITLNTMDENLDKHWSLEDGKYTFKITNGGNASISNVKVTTYGLKMEGEGIDAKVVVDMEKTSAINKDNPNANISVGGGDVILDNDGDIIESYDKNNNDISTDEYDASKDLAAKEATQNQAGTTTEADNTPTTPNPTPPPEPETQVGGGSIVLD